MAFSEYKSQRRDAHKGRRKKKKRGIDKEYIERD
jgi:hypothetical protein